MAEVGATFEFRIAKKPGSAQLELLKGEGARPKGGKKFADLLWPRRVLFEMKSRGEKLERHYDQLFDPVERVFLRDLAASAASFARVFRDMVARGEDRTRAQRFILQLLVYFRALAPFRRIFFVGLAW